MVVFLGEVIGFSPHDTPYNFLVGGSVFRSRTYIRLCTCIGSMALEALTSFLLAQLSYSAGIVIKFLLMSQTQTLASSLFSSFPPIYFLFCTISLEEVVGTTKTARKRANRKTRRMPKVIIIVCTRLG